MPTYDFKCSSCEHMLEEIHPMSSAPDTIKCPECGKKMKRQIGSGVGIIFKGSWPGKEIAVNNRIEKAIAENAPKEQLEGK